MAHGQWDKLRGLGACAASATCKLRMQVRKASYEWPVSLVCTVNWDVTAPALLSLDFGDLRDWHREVVPGMAASIVIILIIIYQVGFAGRCFKQ